MKSSAFTLIELLVSMSIIAVMAVLSISAYPKFSEQVAVTSEVYKILAFAMETKSYGVAAFTDPGVKIIYAFVIEKDNNTLKRVLIKNPTDKTNDYYINNFVDETDSDLKNLIIKNNYSISNICFYGTNSSSCDQNLDKVYIIFKRPNPDARIIGLVGSVLGPDRNTASYSKVEITLKSKKSPDLNKKVVILSTGQIYAK